MDIPINYKVPKEEITRATEELIKMKKASEDAAKSAKKVGDATGATAAPIGRARDEFGRFLKTAQDSSTAAKDAEKNMAGLNSSFNTLSTTIKGIGITIIAKQIYDFTKQIINVRAEFQRFEAVLSNTLGSRSAAQEVFTRLNSFAASTPFQIDELTSSFVKLANQGFAPTNAQMRSLGDLAASTGKSFDQLTEAIIDAQTAEFERLKEFGIRAKNNGDTITFTFKEVQTEVKNTSSAIRDYILSLGDAEGVTGAMDKISATLGGRISNLEDSFTTLMNTLGTMIEGPASDFLSWVIDATNGVNLFLKSMQTGVALEVDSSSVENAEKQLGKMVDAYQRIKTQLATLDLDKETRKELEGVLANYGKLIDQQAKIMSELANQKDVDRLNGKIKELTKLMSETKDPALLKEYSKALADLDAELGKVTGRKEEIGLSDKEIKDIQLYVKHIDMWRDQSKALTEKELYKLNEKLKEIDAIMKGLKPIDGLIAKGFAETTQQAEKLKAAFQEAFGQEVSDFAPKLGDLDKMFKEAEGARAKTMERINKQADKQRQIEYEKEREHQQMMTEIRQASFQVAYDLAGAIYDYNSARRENEMAKFQQQKDFELSLVGDNAQARTAIEERYQEKSRQFAAEEAKRQKGLALFDIAINTASAVVKALPNLILAGIVGAAGIAQGALVAARPLPAYNKGTKGVPGARTGTDSVHALLTPGEKVFPVGTSDRYGPALDAIFDHKISPDIINGFVQGQQRHTTVVNNFDPLIRAWKDNPHVSLHMDERGFHLYNNNKSQQLSKDAKRFKM